MEEKILIFGPVKSRRLGMSLGIELVPKKICNMNCVYCEIGKTTYLTLERKDYYPWEWIEKSILKAKEIEEKFDFLTFTGSGEPTLNIYFEKAINFAKKIIEKPVAVLTNSSLLNIPSVRNALSIVDIVLPSLDAGSEEIFKKINRPVGKLKIKEIIKNLKKLRKEMKGEMWLEILFVKGLNDTEEELKNLKSAIEYINPHKIQLNTVIRPPACKGVEPLSYIELENIGKFLGEKAEIIISKDKEIEYKEKIKEFEKEKTKIEILNYIKRRPATLKEISLAFNLDEKIIKNLLNELIFLNQIEKKLHQNEIFFFGK